MTINSINWCFLPSRRHCKMISQPRNLMPSPSIHYYYCLHNSMMTWCNSRGNIPRTPHHIRDKRTSMRYNPIYYLRSPIFLCIFLSFFPQKSLSNTRTRLRLTPYRNYPTKPIQSPITKYRSPSSLRGYSDLSTSQLTRTKPKKYYPSTNSNSSPRYIFYIPSSRGIYRSLI